MRSLHILAAFLLVVLPCLATHAAQIPDQAQRHRALLIREARHHFGMSAPVATLAAQIHQESRWNPLAVSPAGAQGLAQFMPATARWLPQVDPRTGKPMPFSPVWAIRAMCSYDRWLLDRVCGNTECDRWHFVLSAYNGGLGWVRRDQALAEEVDMNQLSWAHVRLLNSGRSNDAFRENRAYPARILGELTNLYQSAGWGPGACDVD